MRLERIRPTAMQLTLHPYELTALVAAARWVVEERRGELPAEAVEQLRGVLDRYETAVREVDATS